MKKSLFIYKTVLSLSVWTGFVFVSLFSSSLAGEKQEDKFHICFFELDNTVASRNLKTRLTDKRPKTNGRDKCGENKQEFPDAVIHCYQRQMIQNSKGEEVLENSHQVYERMIGSGQKCDGLVFSGHHDGDWYGRKGTLLLKDMEALSCKKKYRDWFNNIKVLWLDGCNTVTDHFIEASGVIKNPDSETVRVVGKTEDKTKLNREYMENYQQQGYAASLDENTSLSSRYLRMFPNTQIYGFNGPAPSAENNQVGKRSYIFEHLENLGKALKTEEKWNSVKKDFTRGLNAIFSNDPCDERKIEVWEKIGLELTKTEAVEHQDYKTAYKLGCDLILAKQVLDNPDSKEAQKALAEKIKQDSKEYYREAIKILDDPNSTKDQKDSAKEMIPILREVLQWAILGEFDSKEAVEMAKLSILKTLKMINIKDQSSKVLNRYAHLLFNNIYDTWLAAKRYKSKDPEFFNNVKSEFKKDSFTKSLEERILALYTASLRKGDYIKFYTEVHDEDIKKGGYKAKFVKKHVAELLDKAENNFPDLQSPRQKNLDRDTKRALAVSVVDQLFQYNLLSEGQIKKLAANRELFPKGVENIFILNVQTELGFKGKEPEAILSVAKGRENNLLRKKSQIQVGAKIFLNQEDKQYLSQLVSFINKDEENQKKYASSFFTALYRHLLGQTDKEKSDILIELRRSGGTRSLGGFISDYVRSENVSQSVKKKYYKEFPSSGENK